MKCADCEKKEKKGGVQPYKIAQRKEGTIADEKTVRTTRSSGTLSWDFINEEPVTRAGFVYALFKNMGWQFDFLEGTGAEYVINLSASQGWTNGENPDKPINRIEAATVLNRYLGIEGVSFEGRVDQFVDIPEGSWMYDQAHLSKYYGIFRGTEENEFKPSGHLNKATVGELITRANYARPREEKDSGESTGADGHFDPLTGIYIVKGGDNLGSIASRFNSTISQIEADNPGISGSNIYAGQQLFLSDLVMPDDPEGYIRYTKSPEEYIAHWESVNGRAMTADERETLARGCIGITKIDIGMEPLHNLDQCYFTFEHAIYKAREENDDLRESGEGQEKKAVIFSQRFWSGDRDYSPESSGWVDMSDYADRTDKSRTEDTDGDGVVDKGYVNFDYGLYDVDTGMWWHANHSEPGMVVRESSLEAYLEYYPGYDEEVFCVVVKDLT